MNKKEECLDKLTKNLSNRLIKGSIIPCVSLSKINETVIKYLSNEGEERLKKRKISKEEVFKSKIRTEEVITLKKIFFGIAVRMGHSMVNIGSYCNLDHSTVSVGYKSFKEWEGIYEDFENLYYLILSDVLT